jgi:hypothetical protein
MLEHRLKSRVSTSLRYSGQPSRGRALTFSNSYYIIISEYFVILLHGHGFRQSAYLIERDRK